MLSEACLRLGAKCEVFEHLAGADSTIVPNNPTAWDWQCLGMAAIMSPFADQDETPWLIPELRVACSGSFGGSSSAVPRFVAILSGWSSVGVGADANLGLCCPLFDAKRRSNCDVVRRR